MAEICAALLAEQILQTETITRHRQKLWRLYHRLLCPHAKNGQFSLPALPDAHRGESHCAHNFFVIFEDRISRDRVQNGLADAGIDARSHYVPLHESPRGSTVGEVSQTLENTATLAERSLRLPLHTQMSEEDVQYVVEKILSLFDGRTVTSK